MMLEVLIVKFLLVLSGCFQNIWLIEPVMSLVLFHSYQLNIGGVWDGKSKMLVLGIILEGQKIKTSQLIKQIVLKEKCVS